MQKPTNCKVLVLDPASSTGYCLVDIKKNTADIYSYGFIDIDSNTDYDADRCIILMDKVKDLIISNNVTKVAVEDYFFSKRFAQGSSLNISFRAAIYIQVRLMGLEYTVLNVSNWKKFISGRTTPTKDQKKKWGKEASKKIMIQESIWKKFNIRFPNHSISSKTGKPIKFRYDVVDAVGQAIYFCKLYLDVKNVKSSMSIPKDIELKNNTKIFSYLE